MSGGKDQTDGTQDAETEAEEIGSTEELSPEAAEEAEKKEAGAVFTGAKPEDTHEYDSETETGDEAGEAGSAVAKSGQETSDTDGEAAAIRSS